MFATVLANISRMSPSGLPKPRFARTTYRPQPKRPPAQTVPKSLCEAALHHYGNECASPRSLPRRPKMTTRRVDFSFFGSSLRTRLATACHQDQARHLETFFPRLVVYSFCPNLQSGIFTLSNIVAGSSRTTAVICSVLTQLHKLLFSIQPRARKKEGERGHSTFCGRKLNVPIFFLRLS